MNIYFLVHDETWLAYMLNRLKQEFELAGFVVNVLMLKDISINKTQVLYKNKPLPSTGFIWAFLYGNSVLGWQAVNLLINQGWLSANSNTQTINKFQQYEWFVKNKINTPKTFLESTGNLKFPVVVKPLIGSHGNGIVMCNNEQELPNLNNCLVQQLITPIGEDFRAFVIHNKVVAAIKRKASAGEFRANVALGATVEKTQLTNAEQKVVLKAAKIFKNSDRCGVDFIRTATGPVVLEVNKQPGIEGAEKGSGVNIAGQLVSYYKTKIKQAVKVG